MFYLRFPRDRKFGHICHNANVEILDKSGDAVEVVGYLTHEAAGQLLGIATVFTKEETHV